MDEQKLIDFLEGLESADFNRVLIRIRGASKYVPKEADHFQQVTSLILYVQSKSGPGLEYLAQLVGKLFPNNKEALAIPLDASPGNATTPERPFMVPFPQNPYFVGREDTLAALEKALADGKVATLTQVMHGLGGIGKTQTAVEYAYRHRNDYAAILWTRADDEIALTTGYANIANALELPEAGAQESAVTVAAVKKRRADHGDWLLIVDNADDPEIVPSFLPHTPNGHILITSRARNFRRLGVTTPLTIQPLPEADAVDFLARSTGIDLSDAGVQKAAKELAQELGYLPLALEQAAAYIQQNNRTFRGYLNEFRKKREELRLLEASPDVGTARHYDPTSDEYREYLTVWTTWQFNIDAVREQDSDAADLLTLCAFLAPDAIPVSLVVATFPERFTNAMTDEDVETAYSDLLLPFSTTL